MNTDNYIEIEYNGEIIKCHPNSWMAIMRKPIQDFTDDELLEILTP